MFSSQIANELHKRVISKFPRRKVIVTKIDSIWAIDLVDMKGYEEDNDDYRYMINIIDVLSKYAWSTSTKTKDAKTVLESIKKVIQKSHRKPDKIWVDRGTEFYNKDFKEWADDNNIVIYSTYGESKSCIVERFNKTLKGWIFKYFTATNTHKWIKVLPKLIRIYNHKKHRTIGMSPKQALTNEKLALDNYNKVQPKVKSNEVKFKVGDFVRISRIKGKFEKGYDANWTREVFQIYEIKPTTPITYIITEYDGTPIEGSFYTQELQKTNNPDWFDVEEVLDEKTVKGKKQYYVKFLGWDKKYNQWVSDLKNIKH